jgi:hypothetical protein
MKDVYSAVIFAAILVLSFPNHAYAYLDAGTGSMLFQALIAAVAAALVVLRAYWGRLKRVFTSSKHLRETSSATATVARHTTK